MSSYRSRNNYAPQQYRENFYDDKPQSDSRSRSRSQSRSRSPHRRSPPYDTRARDRNRDRPVSRRRDRSNGYRDHHHHYAGRSTSPPVERDRARSRSRGRGQGQPTAEIMLENIPSHVTENDILQELQEHYHVGQIDDVRIIKDRQTRQPKGFGFVRFPSVGEAEAFMDANHPTIYLYGDGSKANPADDPKVRIAYGRERKDFDKSQDMDWTCKMCSVSNFATRARCFRCQTARPESTTLGKAANTGDNDAAPDNLPSQFLLFRGLETSVSEELFSKGVAKLNKPSTSSSTSQAPKKAKVASTTGDSNLGAKEGTLRRVLLVRDRQTNESWRYGFAEYASIEDAQAAVTRYNSFDRFTIASRQVIVSYIHAGVFIPETKPSAANERYTFSPIGNPSLKLKYWDEDAYVTELVVFMPEEEKPATRPATQNPADKEGIKPMSDLEKLRKRKQQLESTTAVKKATPSHLQFWSNRHAELHGIQSKSERSNNTDDSAPSSKSYADPNRFCCYLCMRQFNDGAEVNRHERLSDLHRSNLKDAEKVKRAQHKLEKHGVAMQESEQSLNQPKPEYRDRARERRKVYGVVNKKGEQVNQTPAKPRSPSPPAPSTKGANLLAKMGYTAGAGLGSSGQGMTAPLPQNVYAAGVGLGAQGGNLGDAVDAAERNTKGDYGEWVAQGRDKMRERYKNM